VFQLGENKSLSFDLTFSIFFFTKLTFAVFVNLDFFDQYLVSFVKSKAKMKFQLLAQTGDVSGGNSL
jgi:hypothetical protein